MREFLKGLDLDKETIDTIMAEYGKNIQGLKEEKENLSQKIKTYESEITSLKESVKDNDDWKSKFEDLDSKIKKQEEEAETRAADEKLTQSITEVFGDKKFTSEYVKDGIIRDMKKEIAKDENKSKSYKDIFEILTKDKEGIFENEHKPADMPPNGKIKSSEITKEAFDKMSYNQRLELKMSDSNLYNKLRK